MHSKLNFLMPAILIAGLAMPAGAAVAADEHAAHHPASDVVATPSVDGMSNIQKMREQMAAIRATSDLKERARLMDEHMQSMQSTLQQMQQDKRCMMMSNGLPVQGGHGGGMSMMQMMMEQMRQHQEAMQGAVR